MKSRPRLFAGALVIGVALLGSCGGDDEGVGAVLPDVEVAPIDGGPATSLADLRGPAVINLWATTCAPCRAEMPAFETVHQARGEDVAFVGLNVGESAEQAATFIDEVGTTYAQYLDELGEAVTALTVAAMPTTFVIDADGEITTRHIGPMDVDDLNVAIDEALS